MVRAQDRGASAQAQVQGRVRAPARGTKVAGMGVAGAGFVAVAAVVPRRQERAR